MVHTEGIAAQACVCACSFKVDCTWWCAGTPGALVGQVGVTAG